MVVTARKPVRACRWFTLADVPLLEDDVDAMRVLFHADGEGVPREAVNAITAPLDELLTVMALDTPTLATNFRQVLASLLGGGGGGGLMKAVLLSCW